MKKILFITVSLLFAFNSISQVIDTVYLPKPKINGGFDTVIANIDTSYIGIFSISSGVHYVRHDTIPIIMAVSDTSLRKTDMPLLYQQRGYVVHVVSDSYINDVYLDEDKKPIGNNIFIWTCFPTEKTRKFY